MNYNTWSQATQHVQQLQEQARKEVQLKTHRDASEAKPGHPIWHKARTLLPPMKVLKPSS